MKQTEVIQALIHKLKQENIIVYNKDFLGLIGLPADPRNIKRLSAYLRRSGKINNPHFLQNVLKTFQWKETIWTYSNQYQLEQINKSVQKRKMLTMYPGKEALNLSHIIESYVPMNQQQIDTLNNFQKASRMDDAEYIVYETQNCGLFDKKIENQEFLLYFAKSAYQKGMYRTIIKILLPNMLNNYRYKTEIQKIEAHSLGSLRHYDEAKHILNTLIHENLIENINLRTSALSNHKRLILESHDTIDRNELYALVQTYQKLHRLEGIYSYYTGINLLYLVVMGKILFPSDDRFKEIDTEEIYHKSKPSLTTDKTHESYYATMTMFEFKLLLGYERILEKIESFIDNERPHYSLVERTLRQMNLFFKIISVVDCETTRIFKTSINLLEDYCAFFKE